MKVRWCSGGLLVAVLVQLLFFAGTVLAYDISGTITYTGSKTGRVFIATQETQSGAYGTSVAFSGPGTTVPFTIRGVPSGTYTLNAFLSPSGLKPMHASDPAGSTQVSVSGNVTNANITLVAPAAPTPDEALPVEVGVLHGSGADMVGWSTTANQQGTVLADSYNIYWSTKADVLGTYTTDGGSRTNVPANNDKNVFFNSTGGATYFYVMTSVVNGVESTGYAAAAVMPPSTGSTVSGVVALSGGNPSGKQLVIAIGSDNGPTNFVVVTTTGATQAFSIPDVPDGDYWIYPIFDMNDNGLLDEGDIWPSDDGGGFAHVAGGDVDAGTISFAASTVNAAVRTNFWKSNGMTGYNLNFQLAGNMKSPVKLTFTGGTNMPAGTTIDLAERSWGGYELNSNISWTPQVGDSYTFDVTYADNSTETLTLYVTGVLTSLPKPVSPKGSIAYGSGIPTLTWTAPTTPPAGGYSYSVYLWGNDAWWMPQNDLPSTQTSAVYNYDNSAPQPALTDGQTYWWRIAVMDANGNSASNEVGFTYAGAITGKVTSDGTTGIPNVYVQVCKYDSGTGNCSWGYNQANTDAGGNYTVLGLPTGQYKVRFNASNAGYIGEWYNDKADEAGADPVAVTMGAATTGINAVLASGGSISGRVTSNGVDGIESVNVQVCKYDSVTSNCNWNFSPAFTNANGDYTLGGLPAGQYKIQFNASSQGYVSVWYNNTTDMNAAAVQTIGAGSALTGIDAVLSRGGSISGQVTSNGTAGIQNVNVQVCQFDSVSGYCNWGFNGANTDGNGNYTIGGLPAGQYKVMFNGSNMGYINEWYNDTPDMSLAAPQTVSVGATVTGINAVLSQGGSISGKVTNGATGLQNVGVSLYTTNNSFSSIGWTSTDASGNYTFQGVATGDYKVYFDAGASGYASRWYNNKADFNAAQTVSVTAPANTSLADAVLVAGVYYTVTATAGVNGSINPSGEIQVLSGDSREFSVVAYFPSVIDAVGGTCGGVLNGSVYTTNPITQNCTVTLATKLLTYPLTANVTGTGSGSVSGAGTYEYNTLHMLTATPTDANSTFAGWNGDCAGTEPSVSVYMNGPKTCTATFNAVVQHPPSKIGVFSDGYWYLDANQSWAWEGTPTDKLGIFGIGLTGAIPVAGDWNGDGKTEIGVFIDGIWYLDMNGNGQWDGEGIDVRGVFGVGIPNAKPVIGDWNGDGRTKIGIYADGVWYLDMNQNWAWDGTGVDVQGFFGGGVPNAKPVVGDWNGDGTTKIGIFSDGIWYLDMNRNWAWDGSGTDVQGYFGVGLPNVIPVTGDWNGDGTTKIGVYSEGNWYLDKNSSWAWEGEPTDIYGAFGTGLPNVTPVVGNW